MFHHFDMPPALPIICQSTIASTGKPVTLPFSNILIRLALGAIVAFSCAMAFGQSVLLDHRTATYGNPWQNSTESGPSATTLNSKTLVTFNSLPAEGDFQILGRIEVYSRWFGSTRRAMAMLGEKAKSMGANAVVETGVWQAPAFPVMVAPHGTGVAVRINDHELLRKLADSSSTWE